MQAADAGADGPDVVSESRGAAENAPRSTQRHQRDEGGVETGRELPATWVRLGRPNCRTNRRPPGSPADLPVSIQLGPIRRPRRDQPTESVSPRPPLRCAR